MQLRHRLIRTGKALLDGSVLAASFVLACVIRFEGAVPDYIVQGLLFTLPFAVGVQLVCLSAFGLRRRTWRHVSLSDALRVVAALALAGIILGAWRALGGFYDWGPPLEDDKIIPWGVTAFDLLLGCVVLIGLRVIGRLLHERRERRPPRSERTPTLLIGAGRAGAMVAREVASCPEVGIAPVGFLDDNTDLLGLYVGGVPVLGTPAQVGELAARHGAKQALITIAHGSAPALRRISRLCQESGLPVQIIPSLHEIVGGTINLSRIRDVAIEDLLRREPVRLDGNDIRAALRGRRVLVTGAGGSIGSELCRKVCGFGAASLVLVEQAENSLFQIHRELVRGARGVQVVPCIADICDQTRMRQLFSSLLPEVVFHAAAHKHVPLMESNASEAIKNNVLGTAGLARLAHAHGVGQFVLISTDKAVKPASVMGASKRIAELFVQAFAGHSRTRFITVRFGNVLGSNGSVVPLFQEQIARGGPVTVTHPEMRRYFMTIPEACQLVLQAAVMGRGGEIFILDMGEPVKIVDLARDLICLSGLIPDEDVQIRFTGLRPGEKLYEELFSKDEAVQKTAHPRIFVGRQPPPDWPLISRQVEELGELAVLGKVDLLHDKLKDILPDYQPQLPPPDADRSYRLDTAHEGAIGLPALERGRLSAGAAGLMFDRPNGYEVHGRMLPTPATAEVIERMPTETSADGTASSRPRRLTLRHNFAWTFLGNVVYSGCQWGMLVVLAWLGSPEMVGAFALGLAVTAPVFMFTNLQLRSVQATDARGDFHFGDYLGTRLLMTSGALATIAGLVGLSDFGRESAAIILAVAGAKACESVSDVIHGLLQQHERMDRIAVSMMLRGVVSLAALATGVWLTGRLFWGVLGMVLAWALVLAVYDCRSAYLFLSEGAREATSSSLAPRSSSLAPRLAVLGRVIWLALPLGVVTCLISLNTNIPRYFIEHQLGLRALGIFSAIGYLMVAGNTVVGALGQSACPRLAVHYAAGERTAFRLLLLKLAGIAALLGGAGVLIAVLAGPTVLRLVYGPEYAAYNELFVLVMAAAGLGYVASFLGYAVTAARHFGVQTPVFVAVGLVTVAASVLLVPRAGLQGAGWAVLVAMACQLTLLGAVTVVISVRMPGKEVTMGKTIRVLHVLGALNRGGVENWLLHVLRKLDRDRFRLDFLVHTTSSGVFDEEIRALGGAILHCPQPSRAWSYARRFRRLLREHGPYDVVHSHVHHYSGFVLRLARRAGVPARIAHSHTTSGGGWRVEGGGRRNTLHPAELLRQGYLALMRYWLTRHATVCLSASRQAHEALFGPANGHDQGHRVLPCGIDLEPFRVKVDAAAVRAEFGLPPDGFVLGHVGRFAACKNHNLLVAITAEILRRIPNVYLLLVGDGELRSDVRAGGDPGRNPRSRRLRRRTGRRAATVARGDGRVRFSVEIRGIGVGGG